jgi:energy-coupling factor transporter transmembrane protein EcfT
MVLLVTSFQLLVATTTADELRRGLESLGLPEAVSLARATAHRSVSLFEQEWRCIREAQMARGVFARARARARARRGWLRWRDDAHDAVALIVPAIVLATRRAWSLHEAATVRGIGAPRRAGPQRPRLQPLAHAVLGTVLGVLCLLILVR